LTEGPQPSTIHAVTLIIDLTALAAGDEIQHPLLILDVVARGGDHPRTTLVLGNRTGRIESAPFWSGKDDMIRGLAKGMLVQVVGRVTSYREALQLDAVSVRALPRGSVPLSELVPSVGSVERYWQFIDEIRNRLSAPRLKAVVDLFYADPVFRERYEQCPGAPGTGHHAALGGLLQHTGEVLAIGRSIANVAHADEELVSVGVLLHDIGKTESYAWETGVFETTERGRLVGHVVMGAMMLRDRIAAATTPPCTPDEQLILEHLVLSHHGKLEFGSPVRPMTLEAEILNFADDASAKTASITEAYDSTELFPGDARTSVRRVWQLDNRWLMRLAPDFGRTGQK
jgi:3'-5' exoribonuclease